MFERFKFRGLGERRSGASPPKSDGVIKGRSRWYAVSLVPGDRACAAVKYLSKKRWLSSEAPRFPLDRCNMATCNCRYQHHTDRRALLRRGVDRQALPRRYEGQERRVLRKDRRRAGEPPP